MLHDAFWGKLSLYFALKARRDISEYGVHEQDITNVTVVGVTMDRSEIIPGYYVHLGRTCHTRYRSVLLFELNRNSVILQNVSR